ncbi:MAG: 1-acyl-sn-glycerol-3-phosphate acyltransferase [Bacteroidaceae bacterium]
MWQKLARLIYYKWMGWKAFVTVPDMEKCIICVAPHTSNWDFIIAELFYTAIGRKAGFLMKRSWFFFPLGILLKAIGGVPVDRSRKTSLVEQIVKRSKHSGHFHLAITPEATRSLNPNWKQGFYYMALGAELPIVLYAIDYKHKAIYGEKVIYPTGNVEEEMREIKLYFKTFGKNARHLKKFTVGDI